MDRLPDGKVGAVVREGDFHVGQRGRIGFLTSDDGGESWSESTRIAAEARDPYHVAFGCTRQGTLLVSYVLPHQYAGGSWDRSTIPTSPIYLARSEDGGRTWSEPVPIDSSSISAPSLNPYGRIIQTPDGTLLMPVYVFWPEPGSSTLSWASRNRIRGSFILRSRDDGRSWGEASLISRSNHGETSLLYLSSGEMLAALRGASPEGHDVWLAWSEDLGHTWSTPIRVTGHGQHPADLVAISDRSLLLVFGHRRVPSGVRAMVSADQGRTWNRDRVLTLASESIDSDCGYPSVIRLDGGEILVAYYVHQSPGPFVNPPDRFGGPYAAAVKFRVSNIV